MSTREFKKALALTFGFLKASGDRHARTVLAEGLSERAERVQAWTALAAARRRERGLLRDTLFAAPHLSPRAHRLMLRYSDAFMSVLRDAITHVDPEVRKTALELTCRIGGPRVAYLLAIGLRSDTPADRDQAAAKLLKIADAYYGQERQFGHRGGRSRRADIENQRLTLIEPLLSAVKAFPKHQKPELLEAAIGLDIRVDDVLVEILINRFDPRAKVLMAILHSSPEDRVVGFLMEMLRNEDTQEKAREVFAARSDAPFLRGLSRLYRRSKESVLAQRLARLDRLPWPATERFAEALGGMRGEEVIGTIIFVLLSDIAPEQKIQSMSLIYKRATGVVRDMGMTVMRELMAGKKPQEIATRLFRAAQHLQLPPGDNALAEIDEPMTPDGYTVSRLLAEAMQLAPGERRRIAMEIAAFDPDARAKVMAVLRSKNAERQLSGLALAPPMGYADDMLDELLELALSPDNRVRASAVRFLGRYNNKFSVRTLLDAIVDLDRRVVANAVEGVEETNLRVLANVIIPLLKHPNNRIRANAVKALWVLKYPKVAAILHDMVEDPSDLMRLSAVWAMEYVECGDRRKLLSKLAAEDPSERVRVKAAQVLEKLPQ